jgi:hypothetical protein
MGHFMSNHRGQPSFITSDWKNPFIDTHLPPGQTKCIRLVAVKNHKLPLRIWQILIRRRRDFLTNLLHERV